MKNRKVSKEELEAFYKETESIQNKDGSDMESIASKQHTSSPGLPYQCPSCHKMLSTRKEPCKYCKYSGYIPMSEAETKRVRIVLFVVITVIAIAVYVLTKS